MKQSKRNYKQSSGKAHFRLFWLFLYTIRLNNSVLIKRSKRLVSVRQRLVHIDRCLKPIFTWCKQITFRLF